MGGYVDGHGAEAYAEARHGADGAVLLDPYFTRHIQDKCGNEEVVDIGCGAAPWSVYAVQCGALVVKAFDSSTQMLEQAHNALREQPAEVASRIQLGYGTVKALPLEDDTSVVALSINVGCALPSRQTGVAAKDGTLTDHFAEMKRVLAPGGFGIITTPAHLETVFYDTWR